MATAEAPLKVSAAAGEAAQPFSNLRLLLVSIAGLYLEIVLIRWLGTEVKIFAFFQNLTLMVCFLGFGIGCFSSKKRGSLLPTLVATTILVGGVNLPIKQWHDLLHAMSSILSLSADAALWGNFASLSSSMYHELFAASLAVVLVFLMLLVVAMIPLGRWVGYYLESAPRTVSAYSVNLLGSIVGIWLLASLATLWLSPSYWFALAFVLVLFSQPVGWRSALLGFGLLGITLLALRPPQGQDVYWSPYQKLAAVAFGDSQYGINVNNEGYMTIANLTPEFMASHPDKAAAYKDNSYDGPFRFASNTNRVLIIGSGAGNDVAAALRNGAGHVDAVEIDPLIASLGRRLHPEHPYDSAKVRLINNDARNYLRQTHEQYDVIVFALLDSHTEFSGYSNMRVDNYVYTEQSFSDAKRLLAPDGILILKFGVRKPWTWIGQRLYTMLAGIFPQPPVTYYIDQVLALDRATVFIESNSQALFEKSRTPGLAAFLSAHPPDFPLSTENTPPPTTDDWPYIYHASHAIPRAYFSVSALILLMAIYLVGPFFKPKESSTWQFFLLGAGFLLMETQLVSRLALYFGTTWLVNCIALTGILSMLLVSNFYVERRRPEKLGVFYALLLATLVINYVIPWAQVPGPGVLVGVMVCLAYCIPFFFAGVIFTESFRRFAGSSSAFGANMLGAVAGGLAQNLSFIFGMKALLLIAAVLYGAAALIHQLKPKSLSPIA
jgi:spermidine synthase